MQNKAKKDLCDRICDGILMRAGIKIFIFNFQSGLWLYKILLVKALYILVLQLLVYYSFIHSMLLCMPWNPGTMLVLWTQSRMSRTVFFLHKEMYICNCCCSVTQPCLTLCSPLDCSMLDFPVLHHLPKPAQTHVLWASEASYICNSNCYIWRKGSMRKAS